MPAAPPPPSKPDPAAAVPRDAGDGYSYILCTTPSEMARCMSVRFGVFVIEQGYGAEVEVDEKDPGCDHLLLLSPSSPPEDVGTIRVYPPAAKFGRLAVLSSFRGSGSGARLMRVLERHIASGEGKMGQQAALERKKTSAERAEAWEKVHEGKVKVVCNSQKHAEGFYGKLGWVSEGEDFLEEGQPHVRMTKWVDLPPAPSSNGSNGAEQSEKPYIYLCKTEEEIQRAIDIRIEVFVHEQKFSMEDELDEKDPTSDHLLLLPSASSPPSSAWGTIRFHPPTGKLGRLAVLKAHRGTGAGRILVEGLEQHVRFARGKGGEYARANGVKEVVVEAMAQYQAEGFYARCGYERVGEQIMEDGWPHVKMLKTVKIEGEAAKGKA